MIAFFDVGAYSLECMSAYNGRDQAAAYLIDESGVRRDRPRRTVEDFVANEHFGEAPRAAEAAGRGRVEDEDCAGANLRRLDGPFVLPLAAFTSAEYPSDTLTERMFCGQAGLRALDYGGYLGRSRPRDPRRPSRRWATGQRSCRRDTAGSRPRRPSDACAGWSATASPRLPRRRGAEALGVGLQAFVAAELNAHSRGHIEDFERGKDQMRGRAQLLPHHRALRLSPQVAVRDLEHLGAADQDGHRLHTRRGEARDAAGADRGEDGCGLAGLGGDD